jgi:hypothetical protein
MTTAELCRQYWENHFEVKTQSDERSAFSRRLAREAHDELASRLGPDEVENALNNHLEGKAPREQASGDAPENPKPQRIRAPQIMYIEQKSDGNRSLQDQGPAEIGEVSCSKTGRTIYYKGKTFQRENSTVGNYRCLEDGNNYWISGVKKRGTNRHWAGSGPILNTTKPKKR